MVLTTGGGLYRYRLQDLVEVTGHTAPGGGCPVLRFVGREGHVSDWFGEKLHERHVRTALEGVLAAGALQPEFAMLACERPALPDEEGRPRRREGGDRPGE